MWRGTTLLLVLFSFLATTAPAVAQTSTLQGRVVDAVTGEPLPGAHVFVAQTMNGTVTDVDGEFRLSGVRPGGKRLYASMLGYASYHVDLLLPRDAPDRFRILLQPTVLQQDEVVVEAERDKDWHKSLRQFRRGFIGSSVFADSCTILNPEVLRFDRSWWRGLRADAVEPIVVENRALGYTVTYFLDEFEDRGSVIRWDGEPLFEPLTPRDSTEAAQWRANRRAAFYGSMRHFLLALLNDRVKEEGFRMSRIPRSSVYSDVSRATRFGASRDRLLSPGPDSTHLIDFSGRLEVTYTGEEESRDYLRWAHRRSTRRAVVQRSQIKLNDPPVHVDRFGEIVEPYGATVYNYFSFEMRLAKLLPLGYAPDEEM